VALHNVAAGALAAASTSAVKGSQLYATNTNLTTAQNASDAALNKVDAAAAGNAQALASNFVAPGANSVADRDNSFSVCSTGGTRQITNVAKNDYAGIAVAMAMPNMTPFGPGRTVVSVRAANYKGGSAAAAYRSLSGKWLLNGAISTTSTGDAGVRAQVELRVLTATLSETRKIC
jgi:autotransporter adhesin